VNEFLQVDWRVGPYIGGREQKFLSFDTEHIADRFTLLAWNLSVSAIWDWDIHDSTSVGWLAARCQVQRLEEHDAVILSVEAERLAPLLRHAVQLGVRTADMLVGRTSE